MDYCSTNKYLGTYDKNTAIFMRKNIKKRFGKKVKIIFRGRGKRIHFIETNNGTKRFSYNRDLPIWLSKNIAVYLKYNKNEGI